MLIWLPENLYRFVKDDKSFTNIVDKIKNNDGNGDLSTYVDLDSYGHFPEYNLIVPQERRQLLKELRTELNLFFENIDIPEYLRIEWEISKLSDSLDRESFESLVKNIETKIDSLPENSDTIDCKIWFLQHKILYLIEYLNYSYFDAEVLQLRKEILQLYKSDKSFNLSEEAHIAAIQNASDVFCIENKDISLKDSDAIKYTYERFTNSLRFYEEISLQKYPTEYMKNRLGYAKIHYHLLFYSYFILNKTSTEQDFFDLDIWFEEKFNSIEFKYKDFNFIKLKYLWFKFCGNFSFSNYERGISSLQEIYDTLVNAMQNKNLMGKKLNYLDSGSYLNRFFAFLYSVRQLEKEILNDFPMYLNKNQFNSLLFNENEEKLIAMEWDKNDAVSREKIMPDWDYSWLQQKLAG